ncbi:8-amino-7-oxononanoate synthase [Desulfovibrio sp. ZJ369]|uniref:8-amino-7-oxononanoate synthase n=1 Tax=Desulfovibrio sp. ZJ369 TaxID=2709793 RepID=UPI0013EBB464|nr:8-amino-7-oxononanoate synthase [Desulfovibrio sp. ZJ369]
MPLFSIKMRASRLAHGREEHISGAERIAGAEAMPALAQALVARAQGHAKGRPDRIHLKVEAVPESACLRLQSLPVRALACADAAEGLRLAAGLLARAGVPAPEAVIALLQEAGNLRGAMLLDADSLERLEPDTMRGIRATCMDAADPAPFSACSGAGAKSHYREAMVLAAKVAHAPHILAEICISDDPDYVTGYVASRALGYVRIARMKEPGSPQGGRIFLYRGPRRDLAATLDFIERQPVLVENIPDAPGFNADADAASGSFFSQPAALAPGTAARAAARADKWDFLDERLDRLDAQGLRRHIREMSSAPGAVVRCRGKDLLLLASNDYLGLAGDPRVKACAAEALAAYGAGSGGSRLTTGGLELHGRLERRLAAFKQAQAALLFNTGYMANVGVITALCRKEWVIFSDELNHASIIDGCRQSRAQIVVYRHNDMEDLEAKARQHAGRQGLIVSDAVFSMDGDVVCLPELLRIADRCNFLSMIDEAHATGVLGATGRGAAEYFGLERAPDITVGTLSKALGSEGGYVCGNARLIEYLKNSARSFIFSTALSAAPVAAALKALEILLREPERVRRLRENTAFFCARLREQGLAAHSDSAIVPLRIGEEKAALAAAQSLFGAGYYLSAIRYPSVARGSARLRATLRSDHSQQDLAEAARQVGLALRSAR